MQKTCRFAVLAVMCALAVIVSVTEAKSQPSEAQIKKDVMGPKTVSLTLGAPGKVEWSSTYNKYVWSRNFVAKVKTDDPKVFIEVKGYASYDVVGGRYTFWRTFTSGNSYAGMKNLTAPEIQKLIEKFGTKGFMDTSQYSKLVGEVESITLAKDPAFEWHTPNSTSFDIVAVYTRKGNGNTAPNEHVEETFRVRLYRDDAKSDWKSIHSVWKRGRPQR
ncbi:MAG: hypothetical protein IPG22_18975 [Acidobacteria bacterium]|nr:hypothetical protein [Acidobacteriota bacterium]